MSTRAPDMAGEELRRCKAALDARVVELDEALRRIEAGRQRIAGAAHDIRNALAVVLGEADFLTRCLEDPEQLEAAQAVTAAGQIIAVLTRDVLEPVRDARRRSGEVNSSEVMASCQPLMLRIMNHSAECVFAFEPVLWSVVAEQQQLEAALLNLVANARDAVVSGGGVRVAASNIHKGAPFPAGLPLDLPAGDYVAFVVEDTGAGMSAEVLAHATDAFFTTKGAEHGTGLGLSRAKAFATQAGGALQIRSEPGQGTQVEILLPRAVALREGAERSEVRHTLPDRSRSD